MGEFKEVKSAKVDDINKNVIIWADKEIDDIFNRLAGVKVDIRAKIEELAKVENEVYDEMKKAEEAYFELTGDEDNYDEVADKYAEESSKLNAIRKAIGEIEEQLERLDY